MYLSGEKKQLGELIVKRRAELSMEQSDIEDYTGISIGTISKMENGKGNISIDNLLKILDILGLEMNVKVKQTI
ncbi:MAG: helix-turn-helix domain-containing protein [Campylobacterota bacterium]